MRLPDWRAAATSGPPIPSIDEVDFRALYSKTKYVVETADGWSLVITRYRPVKQPFPQPLFGEPLLLVHGFSQNRHTWTSGQFVKNLLFFGVDIHILELRGHGKSSIAFQKERTERFKRPLPPDIDYGWDIDSYFLYDLPAAVSGVKRITRRERIFYCGHSMGGMLGYGYAGIHNDFEGLITIGSPADLGRGFMLLRLLAHGAPMLAGMIDLTLASLNVGGKVEGAGRSLLARGVGVLNKGLGRRLSPQARRTLRFDAVPVDIILKTLERQLAKAEDSPLYQQLTTRLNRLINPERVSADDIRWLLREGGEREPRRVLEQFARWIRRGEMVCYRTGFDFKRGFGRIEVPMAIIFGDLDPLASLESTRSVYRAAKSEYLLWRPVKGNSHIELTMGHDIRQICYDIKNLIEYARTHRYRSPSLPRLR
ncbi:MULTISPECIES: alpha/beta hydrolase [Myxococcus]|uniref:Polyhydroxyalkanoic acid synthase n=1 Tax=Myxococcus xanthus TaxID=34 RepID=A0AAE6KS61_MYXXA|nr:MULTISPECIES: alpha/beta fold hydrolase [Myxococcus]QDE67839.1 polyhydroxyalkanoic acid synthase [Myxococcus xanthus]QDE75116.1 polyhydroxyalkanoic acid synthase [Myxococcus xanthus]QDE82389.1 polyhydroxyalkanoic acid synthase [Myxococcus xanthus]QDE96688.1 polyhydroxyalkanoic acid synthase [Myxococcus xanthus]QDF04187.1 polyhydroxyalkanoic acid synthase [Myxococcus xanthus]